MIVFSETIEDRAPLNSPPGPGLIPLDTKWTVFMHENKVALVKSHLVAGTNRHSNKRYFFWRSVDTGGFFRNAHGNVQPFRFIRAFHAKAKEPWRGTYPNAFSHLEGTEEAQEAFAHAVKITFGITGLHDLYPVAKHFNIDRYEGIPHDTRRLMRTDDPVGFVKEYLKTTEGSVVDKALDTELPTLVYAKGFKGLVPNKNIEGILSQKIAWDEALMMGIPRLNPRKLLYRCTKNTRLALSEEAVEAAHIEKIVNTIHTDIRNRRMYRNTGQVYKFSDEVKSWLDFTNVFR